MPGERREQLAEPVTLGVFGVAAKYRGLHFVCCVADHQVPPAIGRLELLLNVFVAREFVEAGDDQVGFEKPVAGVCGFKVVVGENLEGQMEAPVEFVLPLFGEAAGADDKAALQGCLLYTSRCV